MSWWHPPIIGTMEYRAPETLLQVCTDKNDVCMTDLFFATQVPFPKILCVGNRNWIQEVLEMGIGSMELQRMVGKNRLLTITRIFEDSKFLIFPFPFLFLLAYSVYHMCYVFLGVFCVSYLPDTVSPGFNRVHISAPAHKHVILCASAMCRFCTAQCAVLCRCKLLRSAERAVYWYSCRQHFALYRGGAGTFGA